MKPAPERGRLPRADEIRADCRGPAAQHEAPRPIRCVAALPSAVTGKPQKARMREAMILDLGLRP